MYLYFITCSLNTYLSYKVNLDLDLNTYLNVDIDLNTLLNINIKLAAGRDFNNSLYKKLDAE